jgi:hypothetical protein
MPSECDSSDSLLSLVRSFGSLNILTPCDLLSDEALLDTVSISSMSG